MSVKLTTLHKLSARYAKALFVSANEQKTLSHVEIDCQKICNLMASDPKVARIIKSEFVPTKLQEMILEELKKSLSLHKVTVEFCQMLIRNKRFYVLTGIAKEAVRLAKEAAGIIDVTVQTADSLKSPQKAEIAKILEGAFKKKVNIIEEIKEEILGGLVIFIGSKMIDASLANKVNMMHQEVSNILNPTN